MDPAVSESSTAEALIAGYFEYLGTHKITVFSNTAMLEEALKCPVGGRDALMAEIERRVTELSAMVSGNQNREIERQMNRVKMLASRIRQIIAPVKPLNKELHVHIPEVLHR